MHTEERLKAALNVIFLIGLMEVSHRACINATNVYMVVRSTVDTS